MSSAQERMTTGAGRALGGAVAVLSRVRRVEKPMHPRGAVVRATLRRHGADASSGARSGAEFLDEPGTDEVVVRISRSVGLPAPLPDVNGIAIRVPSPGVADGTADLLLATTGHGRLTRYLITPTVRSTGPFCSSLVPYGSPTGAVHVAARPRDASTWELLWARAWSPASAWTSFATLELERDPGAGTDEDIAFDAVRAAPPGLEVLDWHRRLRAPGYAAARRSRGEAEWLSGQTGERGDQA